MTQEKVAQGDQAVEGRNRSKEFLPGKKISFLKFLVPRNNKLSQVTVHLFLGPKGAAVSYSIIYKTTKETHSSALSNQFFLTT